MTLWFERFDLEKEIRATEAEYKSENGILEPWEEDGDGVTW
jgi:hypothetical protein